MSRYVQEEVECPHCEDRRGRAVYRSVDASRSPELRAAILDGSFHAVECEACGGSFVVGSPFVYIDRERGEWIAVFSRDDRTSWRALEGAAEVSFDRCAGEHAPALARRVFAGCKRRTVFGLDALREKLVCWAAGLEDVELELLKLCAFGVGPQGAPLGVDRELRLVDVEGELLTLVLVGDEAPGELFTLERAGLVGAVEAAGPLRRHLTEGPLVDLTRWTLPGDAPAALALDGRPLY